MKNKKGFTLVELLAVIVVLAIIMIIAVPAVLDSMEAARFNSFKVFGQNAIRKAMELRQEEELTGKQHWVTAYYYNNKAAADYDRKNCYPLDVLKIETGGKYKGSVWYDGKDFRLYLTDGTYYTYFYPYKAATKETAATPTRRGLTLSDINNATLQNAKNSNLTKAQLKLSSASIRLVSLYDADIKKIDSSYSSNVVKKDWFGADGTDQAPGMISLCGRKFAYYTKS